MGYELFVNQRLSPPTIPGECLSLCEGDALIPVINGVLVGQIISNGSDPTLSKRITEFHGLEVPKILLLDYLRRIEKYAFCSRSCFVIALVYLERLAAVNSAYRLTPLNVHRLYLTALLIAIKFHEDVFYDNAHFAKVGGIVTSELNSMEVHFLTALDYKVHVRDEDFFARERALLTEVWTSSHHSCVEAQLLLTQSGLVGNPGFWNLPVQQSQSMYSDHAWQRLPWPSCVNSCVPFSYHESSLGVSGDVI